MVLPRVLVWAPLLALAALYLGSLNLAAADQGQQDNTYYDGRLLILDQYRTDGSHKHDFLLLTVAEQIIPLEASEQLEPYKTNDALRVWVKTQAPPNTNGEERLILETQEVTGPLVVERLEHLKQDWVIPGDSADVWGDGLFTKDDLDSDIDNDGSGTLNKTEGTWKKDDAHVELQTILAQGLKFSQLDTGDYIKPPYGSTTKVVSDISMIVYVVSICDKGGGPATTAQTWNKTMMSGTLPNFVSACSNGIGYVAPANTRVVDIPLGCSGSLASTGDTWTYNSCSGDNLMRIAYAADEYALLTLKINPRKYRHHVVVLPPNLPTWMGADCDWAGTAVMGFSGPAWTYMWVAGDVWDQPQLYLHEIGHNYMLGHSDLLSGPPTKTSPTQEQGNIVEHGDWSSIMGYCCVLRCFHAAHMWQMGWAQALAVLDKTQLSIGTVFTYVVPPPSTTRRSFVTVTTNWLTTTPQVSAGNIKFKSGNRSVPSPPVPARSSPSRSPPPSPRRPPPSPSPAVLMKLQFQPQQNDVPNTNPMPPPPTSSNDNITELPSPHTFWISWRPSEAPYDLPPTGYADGVLIHLYDGTSQSDVQESFLQARLQLNQTTVWKDMYYGSGLVIKLNGVGTAGANVSICRTNSPVENTMELCTDGLDNDCNGLADVDDPACAGLIPSPSPPVTFFSFQVLIPFPTTNRTEATPGQPASNPNPKNASPPARLTRSIQHHYRRKWRRT